MFQISGVQEFENCIKTHLGANVLKRWGTLRNLEKENISFLVGGLRIIGAMKTIFNDIDTVLASETA